MEPTKDLIIRISTESMGGCPLCSGHWLGGKDRFDESCSHLMKQHGLRCLHVGQESGVDGQDRLWQFTVAVFGR